MPTAKKEPKSGWKTTEFWVAVSTQIISVLVLLGIMTSADSATVGQAVTESIESAGIIIANIVVVLGYIRSRTEVKKNGG